MITHYRAHAAVLFSRIYVISMKSGPLKIQIEPGRNFKNVCCMLMLMSVASLYMSHVLVDSAKLHSVLRAQNKSNIELELKTWKQKFEQEKLAHEEDLARFNAVKKDLIVSKEEANLEALKGQAFASHCVGIK